MILRLAFDMLALVIEAACNLVKPGGRFAFPGAEEKRTNGRDKHVGLVREGALGGLVSP
jgi:hypothetical protein